MYLRRQKRDTEIIDELAVLCRGKAAIAAVLADRGQINTISDAAAYINRNPSSVNKILSSSGFLYYRWISEHSDQISAIIREIDFNLVAKIHSSGGQSASKLEDKIIEVVDHITGSHKILSAIEVAYNDEVEKIRSIADVLQILGEMRSAAKSINGICWRIRHPWPYLFSDRRVIYALFVLSFVAVSI